MRMTRHLPGLLLLLPAWAYGCSLQIGTVLPSNYELVQLADAIVVARSQTLEERDTDSRIRFEVYRILKGPIDAPTLSLRGHLEFAGRSVVGDYSRARRGGYGGACRAYDYRLDQDYLLFLVRAVGDNDTPWRVLGTAFARTNEELAGSSDPWITVVEHYVRIGALDDFAFETHELRRLLATEAYQTRGFAADITHWLNAPSSRKPVSENIALFRENGLDTALWVLAGSFSETEEARELMNELVVSGQWHDYIGPVARFFSNAGDSRHVDTFIEHYGQVKTNYPLLGAIVELADDPQNPAMLRLLRAATDEERRLISRWFVRHPDTKATEFLASLVRSGYDVDWQWAIVLAGMGHQDVLDWAINETRDSWVADYVIARSPLTAADAARAKILDEANPQRLMNLVHAQTEMPAPDLNLIYRAYQRADVHCKAAIRKNVEMLQGSFPEARSLLSALPPAAAEASEDACY